MPVHAVFPTFIYRGRLTPTAARPLNRDLAREIETLREIDDAGVSWSDQHYREGYSSYASAAQLHHTSPNFGELRDRLEPHLTKFVRALKWQTRARPRMTTCWANAMGLGTYHTLHLHPLSVISGVYYVNAPADASALKIEDPRMGLFMASPPRPHYLHVTPKPGDFVLFESWAAARGPAPPIKDPAAQRQLQLRNLAPGPSII